MEKLWAPWREKYVRSNKKTKKCILCQAAKKRPGIKSYILKKGKYCFIILNIFPYNNGHLMVVPYQHSADMSKFNKNEILEIFDYISLSVKTLKKALKPDGFNIGVNLGNSAGAGVVNHIHYHIVPRWAGDTNFMAVTGKTKVIPVSLETTYRSLKKAIK
jgi:ATP adenylyltransferase